MGRSLKDLTVKNTKFKLRIKMHYIHIFKKIVFILI